MTTQEAAKIVKTYNEWKRAGKRGEVNTELLGEALDVLLAYYEEAKEKVKPQDTALNVMYTPRGNTTIEDQMNLYREMNDKETERMNIEEHDRSLNAILDEEIGEETDEEAAYRKGYMDGYDEGLNDGMYK